MMDDENFKKPPTSSIAINMFSGAAAGVLELGLMYPMDSVRTRMQSLSPEHSALNIYETFIDMIKSEGLFRPLRGVSVVIASTIPASALYFGSYEMSKKILSKFSTQNNINYMSAGVIATILHDAAANPSEVIKQRLQMYNSPYNSVITCMKGIYRHEGLKAFYRSFATQLCMNVPVQALHLLTYEYVRVLMNPERKFNPTVQVVAGGTAGATAAVLTTPLDVVRTLLNTQEIGNIGGMIKGIRKIYNIAGVRGFLKGLEARLLKTTPGAAIGWTSYEFFKNYLCEINNNKLNKKE
ncbi:mitoferrin-like [Episyrphus balteatus]|uniref:mitoferrin-like n=1 Tax=Episyrphus balteatus TaxID=286459 RepID=UPI0024860117|nr:mitoferrin-like [Episyrphus balteatus]